MNKFLVIDSDDLGTTQGTILKRDYAFSHYSRYVRPGFQRVRATVPTATAPLRITAYTGDNSVVTVILNNSQVPVFGLTLQIPGTAASALAFTTMNL